MSSNFNTSDCEWVAVVRFLLTIFKCFLYIYFPNLHPIMTGTLRFSSLCKFFLKFNVYDDLKRKRIM